MRENLGPHIGDEVIKEFVPKGSQLRFISWNIQQGKHLGALLDEVKRNPIFQGIDGMLLQEASRHNGITDAERIARMFGSNYFHTQYGSNVINDKEQENAIIWNTDRFSDVLIRPWDLPKLSQGSASAWEKKLYKGFKEQEKNGLVLWGTLQESIPFQLGTFHPDVHGLDGHRAHQIGDFLSFFAGQSDAQFQLIAGDFNMFGPSILWPKTNAIIAAHGFTDATKGNGGTFKTLPRQRLDRVLYKGDMRISTHVLREIRCSDHFPVSIIVSFPS